MSVQASQDPQEEYAGPASRVDNTSTNGLVKQGVMQGSHMCHGHTITPSWSHYASHPMTVLTSGGGYTCTILPSMRAQPLYRSAWLPSCAYDICSSTSRRYTSQTLQAERYTWRDAEPRAGSSKGAGCWAQACSALRCQQLSSSSTAFCQQLKYRPQATGFECCAHLDRSGVQTWGCCGYCGDAQSR